MKDKDSNDYDVCTKCDGDLVLQYVDEGMFSGRWVCKQCEKCNMLHYIQLTK